MPVRIPLSKKSSERPKKKKSSKNQLSRDHRGSTFNEMAHHAMRKKLIPKKRSSSKKRKGQESVEGPLVRSVSEITHLQKQEKLKSIVEQRKEHSSSSEDP